MKKCLVVVFGLLLSASMADGSFWQEPVDFIEEFVLEEFPVEEFVLEEVVEEKVWTEEEIVELIIKISVEEGVPPEIVLAIAYTENWTLNPKAVSPINQDGSVDLGVMQLNSNYFGHVDWECPEANVTAGVRHIRWLMGSLRGSTWWSVAVAYNAGLSRVNNPPASTLTYADKVIEKFTGYYTGYAPVLIFFPRR